MKAAPKKAVKKPVAPKKAVKTAAAPAPAESGQEPQRHFRSR